MPGKHLESSLFYLLSAIHALLFGNYDLIHLHKIDAGFVAPILRLRYKIIATSHESSYLRDKWSKPVKSILRFFEYLLVKFPDKITSVSSPLVDIYKRKYKRSAEYIPNGVNSEKADTVINTG